MSRENISYYETSFQSSNFNEYTFISFTIISLIALEICSNVGIEVEPLIRNTFQPFLTNTVFLIASLLLS